MINFGDDCPARPSRNPAPASEDATSIVERQSLAQQAVRVSQMLALAYTLSDHFERETVDLPHRDVREAVSCLLDLVEFLDRLGAAEKER
jgi:hypothetical protein